jgi:hypothetical protein
MLFVFQKAKMTRARMISQPMSMTTKTRIFRSIQIEGTIFTWIFSAACRRKIIIRNIRLSIVGDECFSVEL